MPCDFELPSERTSDPEQFSDASIVLSRRKTRTEGFSIALFAVTAFGGFTWFVPPLRIGAILIGGAVLAFAGYLVWKNSAMELKVVDGHLCWIDDFSGTNGRVAIACIVSIRLEHKDFGGEPGTYPDFFIVLQDGKQVLLPLNVISSCPRVISAIQRLNPSVTVEEGESRD